MVNISLFSTNPDVLYSFPCVEMRETQETFPRYPRTIHDCAEAVFSLEIANQVVQRCKLPKVVLVSALYGLGQLLISLVVL